MESYACVKGGAVSCRADDPSAQKRNVDMVIDVTKNRNYPCSADDSSACKK